MKEINLKNNSNIANSGCFLLFPLPSYYCLWARCGWSVYPHGVVTVGWLLLCRLVVGGLSSLTRLLLLVGYCCVSSSWVVCLSHKVVLLTNLTSSEVSKVSK